MSDEPLHVPPEPGEDWLWDRSGPPDPDVARLEALLEPLAAPAALAFEPRAPGRWRRAVWSLAAASVLAAGVLWALVSRGGPSHEPSEVLVVADGGTTLAPGEWIEAGATGREVRFGEWGFVTLEPGTRMRLAQARGDVTRFFLQRGRVEAFVSALARPRFFQVDTRAARCVDLGCRYTLEVDREGVSHVRVKTGQVAFEVGSREVYVPAGATCSARPGRGVGTPLFEDAPEALVRAARAYDEAGAGRAPELLAAVRSPRDALAALHLLGDPAPEVAAAAAAVLRERFGVAASGADHEAWRRHLERLW